ncbi:MAG: nicotinamide-nucleotide amidase [Cyclobacteriaceae bacterium]|jgi:nicotinamide-nucleotide amidase
MPTLAEIITIGDEILYGQTLDTNSHWMSGQLDQIGIKVIRKTTIGDEREEILACFKEAEARAEVILITGGLGPTSDDLTKPLLTEYFDSELVLNEEALKEIEALFKRINRKMSDANRGQAMLPLACEKVTNSYGTAPGMWFNKNGKIFISMPGVPYEMRHMMSDIILPRLAEKYLDGVIHHRMIKTIGIPESTLAELIEDWEKALPSNIRLAYLPSFGQVKLRLTAFGNDFESLRAASQSQIDAVLPKIQKYVFGFDDDEIEYIIGKKLIEAKKTIAFAESCTGGYLSHLITKIPGSSAYFKGSIISYAYDVKERSLDVNHSTMNEMGAVSEEVVIQMAIAIREKLQSDIGISISGIAGPDGGTEDKPVGTVWIAYSDEHKTVAKKYQYTKDRLLNIQFAAMTALNMFRINFLSE